MEGREDALADDVPELVLGHSPVEPKRGDDVQVLDPDLRGHVDDLFHHKLPNVGRRHRRERKREVVKSDRQLHAPA